MKRLNRAAFLIVLTSACRGANPGNIASRNEEPRLPTGAHLDPAGRATEVGSLPLAMVPSPDGRHLVLLINGFREQGIQVVDRASGAVTKTVQQRAAFLGLVFSHDGQSLYASGGDDDVIYHYRWIDGNPVIADTIFLDTIKQTHGIRYPAGIALSPDDRTLYVAENLGDSLAVIDLANRRVTQRLATERYPYGVVVGNDGRAFVSAWGGSTISVFTPS